MLFGKYTFTCRLDTDAELPAYKGSTFRGVFGRALKKVVCALPRNDCGPCLLKNKCIYVQVFETPGADSPEGRAGNNSRPHPFVIEPPLASDTRFSAGALLDFNLLLFGPANDYLPYFIYAFQQMGIIGIGRKIAGRRGAFTLQQVAFNGRPIYALKDQQLRMPPEHDTLTLDMACPHPDAESRLGITLETPLRLKFNNRLKADLPFHVLVRAMLRRVSTLMQHYDGGEPDLDYPGLVHRAESVRIIRDETAWLDWRRYSFRQEQEMLMGGMTGSVMYEGKIGEFLPLIAFAEQVHLGKQTTFGLGRIKADAHIAE
ncbi:MAG: CRISPR system precrRNA processing endoribonuclease RAMP protein Cas6 [Thermodesulfobacteriota bacterium]